MVKTGGPERHVDQPLPSWLSSRHDSVSIFLTSIDRLGRKPMRPSALLAQTRRSMLTIGVLFGKPHDQRPW